MANFSKQLLSGSTNGRNIKVTGTSSGTAVTVHTAVSGTSSLDEVWIYAVNSSTPDQLLTIEFGGTTNPDDTIEKTIPGNTGLSIVVPGLLLQNSLEVTAFAAAANVINLNGFVNRIS